MNVISQYGFVLGPPIDRCPHLAFAIIEPLHSVGPQVKYGRHVAQGYVSHGYFTKTDGWIGWRIIRVLFHHPATVKVCLSEDAPYFVSEAGWERQLGQLLPTTTETPATFDQAPSQP